LGGFVNQPILITNGRVLEDLTHAKWTAYVNRHVGFVDVISALAFFELSQHRECAFLN
jgi:hypothetical protein